MLPAHAYFGSTTAGDFIRRNLEDQAVLLREGVIHWPWNITVRSLFTHAFGGSVDTVMRFPEMHAAACAVCRLRQYGEGDFLILFMFKQTCSIMLGTVGIHS